MLSCCIENFERIKYRGIKREAYSQPAACARLSHWESLILLTRAAPIAIKSPLISARGALQDSAARAQ